MPLHDSTFAHVKPTNEQMDDMEVLRGAARVYAATLDRILPEGPDKTYTIRKLREVAMWANTAVTRHVDGTPRDKDTVDVLEYPPNHPAPGDLGSVPA